MSSTSWEIGNQLMSLSLSDEDVEELRSERSIKHSHITKEELEKLTVDETLSQSERILYFLREGEEVQKIHGLSILPGICNEYKDCSSEFIQLIAVQMPSAAKDVILASLICTKELALKSLLTEKHIEDYYLEIFFNFFKTRRDRDIMIECLNVINSLPSSAPSSSLTSKLLDFVLLNSSLSSGVLTREASCFIIQYLCCCLPEDIFCNKLLPIMKSLCQDVELDVRACMCRQLEKIHSRLSGDIVEKMLLPELYLLVEDEELVVKDAALTVLCNIFPRMEQEGLVDSTVIEMILSYYKKTMLRNTSEEVSLASHFIGKIFYSLLGYWRKDEKDFLIHCYQLFSKHGSDENNNDLFANQKSSGLQVDKSCECRFWCAYNFPAFLTCIQLEEFDNVLFGTYKSLCKDSNPLVRKCVASSFHEVARLLTKTHVGRLKEIFLQLLLDRDFEVLYAIMENLSSSLEYVMSSYQQESEFLELLDALLSTESFLSSSLRWRVHVKMVDQLFILEKYYTSDQIYLKVIPVLLENLKKNKPVCLHHSLARLLLHFYQSDANMEERMAIHHRIITEFAESSCYRKRMLFLDICQFVPQYFSKSFFKEFFYEFVLSMASDSVVNVRVKFCKSLVLLKSQLQLPSDRLQLQILEQTVRRIMALENDRDVSNTIRSVIVDLDSMSVCMDDAKTPENIADKEKEKMEQTICRDYYLLTDPQRKNSMEKGEHLKRARNSSFTSTKETNQRKVVGKGSRTNSFPCSKHGNRSKELLTRKTPSLNATNTATPGCSSSSRLASSTVKKGSSHSTSTTRRQAR